jgi:hypothetical protein
MDNQTLKTASATAQDKLAEELFDPEKVLELLKKQAAQGFQTVEIAPDVPVKLAHCRATRKLVAILHRRGLQTGWDDRVMEPDDKRNPFSRRVKYRVLVISWDPNFPNVD